MTEYLWCMLSRIKASHFKCDPLRDNQQFCKNVVCHENVLKYANKTGNATFLQIIYSNWLVDPRIPRQMVPIISVIVRKVKYPFVVSYPNRGIVCTAVCSWAEVITEQRKNQLYPTDTDIVL